MGADVDRIYRAMKVIAEMPDGTAILDVPCGGGIAMLRLRPDQRVHYVGVDISAPTLQRAHYRSAVASSICASASTACTACPTQRRWGLAARPPLGSDSPVLAVTW
jgi:cyclopropane fatty-acyl-phospholipid synthase-like methyltransferase